MTSERLARLRAAMADAGLDGLLVSSAVEDSYGRHSQNRRYLSGFSGSTGLALVTGDRAVVAVDFRYVEQAERECSPEGFDVWKTPGKRQIAWLPTLLRDYGLAGKRIGLARHDFSLDEYLILQEAVASMAATDRPVLEAAEPVLERQRRVKTADEIRMLTVAVETADRAYERVLESLRPGITERAVARAVEEAVRAEGGEGVSFETIVAAGPWAAMPHASPRDEPLREGDMIVIDMGALYGGYCSDLTRTTFLGRPDDRFLSIYGIVHEAQAAAIEGVRTGMASHEVDALARGVISRAGYGDAFGHGLGHGVGLQIHESPYLGSTGQDVLEDGMVFTIEPGIYLPGWGGVRIEDVVVLEGGKARVLSRAKKLTPAGVFP